MAETTTTMISTTTTSSESSPAELVSRFGTPDYVVFAGMLTVSAAIGIYYACSGSKQSTTKEFLMGNRSMSVFPVSMSVLASFMSAITLLGTPAEVYQYGTQYWMIIISYFFVIPMSAHLYLPIFYNLGLTSAYEYLERRFSRVVRTLGSMVFSIQMIMYMAIVLYAPSLALSQVTGISVWSAVLSIGLVCTFYTAVGGIKAVVWTDLFQVTMMFIAMFVVVFKGAADEGGWANVWQKNLDGQRIEFFNFNPDPTVRHTVWNLAVGGYFTWVSIYGVNQAMVQRYLSIPTLRGAQTALWLNLPGLSVLLTISCMAGLVIYTKYETCDPLSWTNFKIAPDQLFPLFVMDVLGFLPGLPGLFVSGIFSGALSTVSSGVNSLAAVTLEDFVKAYIKKDISELWATRLTKILAIVYGVIAIALVAVAQLLGNVLQAALSIFGMIGGPLIGLFSLGMFFPWANAVGAITGLFSGLGIAFWVGFGSFVHKPAAPKSPFSIAGCHNGTALLATTVAPSIKNAEIFGLYRISYIWFSGLSCCVVIIVGLLVSFITGLQNPEDVDPKLIIPVFDKLCCCLPAKVRRKLRFHVGRNVTVFPKDMSVSTMATVVSSVSFEKPPFQPEGISNIAFSPSSTDLGGLTMGKDKINSNEPECTLTPL
ncbi:sodium-coupled monocarboxylate transporter 1-like [Limulus polyphemus]|uniref:Sodium-coupled monocarboxylate transporter 1-like n=1 Tax=Limulus polyphemus TaxID=6850 RepID=A0ABM1T3E4_LIMPO|nr:sodium-coupled monocarboxylate transporter 1-like [Limulus polyphemus]